MGKKFLYRIAGNGKEILLIFLKTYVFFILWTLKIQWVEGRASSQSFNSGYSSIFANLHKDTSRFAMWPTLPFHLNIEENNWNYHFFSKVNDWNTIVPKWTLKKKDDTFYYRFLVPSFTTPLATYLLAGCLVWRLVGLNVCRSYLR